MRKPQADRALIVVAMFTLAVMYASFCATKCAFEDLPGLDQYSESRSGETGQSQDSGHGDPADSGCVASDHLDAFVPATAVTAECELGSVGLVNVSATSVSPVPAPSFALPSFRASDLDPPYPVTIALYQQNSVLRV
jgi:hypothetical protein